MLDLETMGTGPTAAIVAIGAVRFDIESGLIDAEFYHVITLSSAVKSGGQMDPATVEWWMNQSAEARQIFASKQQEIVTFMPTNAETALHEFRWYLQKAAPDGKIALWGNGGDFDNVILRSAYKRADMEAPWRFGQNRCYRTLKSFRPDIVLNRGGTHHNALDDARSQAEHAIRIFKAIGVLND